MAQFPPLTKEATSLTTRSDRAQRSMEDHYFFLVAAVHLKTCDLQLVGRFLPSDASLEFTDRDRKVFVSCIQWFGTKYGLLFLNEVKRLVAQGIDLELAVRSEWKKRNLRIRSHNLGYTLIEHILDELRLMHEGQRPSDPTLVSPVSDRDQDIALASMLWAHCHRRGRACVNQAERLIKQENRREHEVRHLQNLNVLSYA